MGDDGMTQLMFTAKIHWGKHGKYSWLVTFCAILKTVAFFARQCWGLDV